MAELKCPKCGRKFEGSTHCFRCHFDLFGWCAEGKKPYKPIQWYEFWRDAEW